MGHILKRKNIGKYPVTHIILKTSIIAFQVYSTNNSCLVIKHASFGTKVYLHPAGKITQYIPPRVCVAPPSFA